MQAPDSERSVSKALIGALIAATVAAVAVVLIFLFSNLSAKRELESHVGMMQLDPRVLESLADGKASPALKLDAPLAENLRSLPLEQQAIVRARWVEFQKLAPERRAELRAAFEKLKD